MKKINYGECVTPNYKVCEDVLLHLSAAMNKDNVHETLKYLDFSCAWNRSFYKFEFEKDVVKVYKRENLSDEFSLYKVYERR